MSVQVRRGGTNMTLNGRLRFAPGDVVLDQDPKATVKAIRIRNGRHPIVERLAEEPFVPNDATLDPEENRILIITGPNMAGKCLAGETLGRRAAPSRWLSATPLPRTPCCSPRPCRAMCRE